MTDQKTCPACVIRVVNPGMPFEWRDPSCTGRAGCVRAAVGADDLAAARSDIPALLAHIDALTARVAELDAGQGWRSMDTAPRDGTKFIAINKYGDVTYPVKWDDDCQMWVEYGLDGFDTMGWVRADRPDLWAPIPKPPTR